MEHHSHHLFECFGIELEYMITDQKAFDIMPVADKVLAAEAGEITSDVERGDIAWSNELVLHVIELKTNGPVKSLSGLPEKFGENIGRINHILSNIGGCLMPTAAHPWMNPYKETVLWPHEYSIIYETYNRIFGCQGHGWSNLQSMHINLPFSGDDEFGKLHAAIRLVLPIIPSLTASSPILNAAHGGYLDARMLTYGKNSEIIPSIAGKIIPERAYTQKEYEERIFLPMYADIAPYDPDGVLQHEFLNSRGAIARFDRGSIEIRVIDIQECPRADLASAALIISCLQHLAAETWTSLDYQKAFEVDALAGIYGETIKSADKAVIDNAAYLEAFGVKESKMTANGLWRHIFENTCKPGIDMEFNSDIDFLLKKGPLARRILYALDGDYSPNNLKKVYSSLSSCLMKNELFHG